MSHKSIYTEVTADERKRKSLPENAFYYRPTNGLYYTKQGFPILTIPATIETRHESVSIRSTAANGRRD